MSDISIPGVNSKYNTQKMVEDLVKVKKVHLDDLEKDLTTLKDQKRIWQELSQKLTQIRDSAKSLYSFQNPFNQKKAVSTDETALTATADRNAIDETLSILVKSTAKPDKFLSRALPRDYRIPAGTYNYSIGSKDFSFRYSGGKLSDFADVLMKRSNGLVKTQVISNTSTTQVMSIEATKTGAENRLVFREDAARIGLDMGFLRESGTGTRKVELAENTLQPWKTALDRNRVTVEGGSLKIRSGGEGSIPLTPPASSEKKMVLEMEVRVLRKKLDPLVASAPPPGPSVPETGSVSLAGVTVEGMRSTATLPKWTPPPLPVVKTDPVVFFVEGGGSSVPLPEIGDSEEFKTVRITLSDYVKELSALTFRNNNTHSDIEVKNISIYDPESRGDFNPANAVTQASDAVIEMNGIEIIRPVNDISDLVPGVTLRLFKSAGESIDLTIEPDRKAIKDSLITFVGYYNQLITQINILTRTDEKIVSGIEYFTPEERKTAEQRLGLFQGDITLMQMKTRLQSIMMDSYRSGSDNAITVLSQIGISTDSRKPGSGGYEASKLLGNLEIQEAKLDEVLKGDITPIKNLFGSDSDGDLIMDTGVAVRVDSYLKPYVETGGIFTTRQTGIDRKITSTGKDIDSYKDELTRYERDLKIKYGQMEGALGSLERSSQSIENFSNNNSGK